MKLKFVIIIFLTSLQICYSQSWDRTYNGLWARTFWVYEFKADNSYNFHSSGHAGNFSDTGIYRLSHDTIFIGQSVASMKESFILDGDSIIIHTRDLREYRLHNQKLTTFYECKIRYDILPKINIDSIILITKPQFDSIVESSTNLLTIKRMSDLTNRDHIQIIRTINSIRMGRKENLIGGIYDKFLQLIEVNEYEKELPHYYYDWIPNRGMGYYFKLLQIELGGKPSPYSRYTIQY